MKKYYNTILIIINLALVITLLNIKLSNRNHNSRAIPQSNSSPFFPIESKYLCKTIPDLGLTGLAQDTIMLDQLCSTNDVSIILRIPLYSCGSCIDKELQSLSLNIDSGYTKNMFILSSFERFRQYYAQFNNFSICQSFYTSDILLSELDEMALPYYLIVNSKRQIFGVYFVDDSNTEKISISIYDRLMKSL